MTQSISYRRILNRMGYYNYQSSLIYRHLNQDGLWDSHLQHCRTFIMKAIDLYKPANVTVLGSGWLLDLPLAEMIEKTGVIRLVDIVHPPEVKKQTESLSSVELVEDDITGGLISEVWEKTGRYSFLNKLRSLKDIVIPEYQPGFDPGLVISLNILTQLESMLLVFLKKRSAIGDEELLAFRTEIQKKHISFLEKHNSVLITDLDEVVTEKSGKVSSIPDLLTDIPPGKYSEEWTWNFDLTGTDYYNRRSIMKMKAIII